MNLFNKILCHFFLVFVTAIFPQEQFYLPHDCAINNMASIKNITNFINSASIIDNDSGGVLDSIIILYMNGMRFRNKYIYNNDLSLNSFTVANWYNGEWITFEKHTNTYNSGGCLESVLWELYDPSSGIWEQEERDFYTYDSSGNRNSHIHQYFDGLEFVNDFKSEDQFKGKNLVLSTGLDWSDNRWVFRSKSINKFTADNLKESSLFQQWINDQWINLSISHFEYDENFNLVANVAKRWQNGRWLFYSSGNFEYDNNNMILESWQIARDNYWENWFRIFYEYDDNNFLIHLYGKEWEDGNWVAEDEALYVTNPDGILFAYLAKEVFLYYSEPVNVESEKYIADGFELLQNYPNPFNPGTVITYSIPEYSFVSLNIYNLLGEKIKTLVKQEQAPGEYQINFDGSSLSGGIYFYQLETEKFRQTKKMTLLR